MLPLTTGQVLKSWSYLQPDTIALIDAQTDEARTYAQLDKASDQLAFQLKVLGVGADEVISFLLTDSLGIITLVYAIGKIGAAWTPLNPRATLADWVRQLEHCQSRTVIYNRATLPHYEILRPALPQVTRWIDVDNAVSLPVEAIPPLITPFSWHKLAGLLYTSGTTSAPKGVRHTHQTLWGWNYSLLQSTGLSYGDCVLNPYPLFHMGGIGFTLAAIQAGATTILDTPFQSVHFVDSVHRYHPTVTFMVPTMVQALLDLPAPLRRSVTESTLRRLTTTSAPLLTTTRRDMERAWPRLEISVLYSATEAVYSLLRHENRAKDLCVGRPAFGARIRILDDQFHDCPHSVMGTIYVRGLSLFAGYHVPAVGTKDAWHNQWFTCRDVGYLDSEGYLYLIDRANDLINSGGEKISSLEIESALQAHPGVREAAVVGVEDPYWGERIHAVVVRATDALTQEQLYGFLAERLPRYKLPRSLEFVPALPKGETGKVLKQALRAPLAIAPGSTAPPVLP
ncbi:MAG: long-chain fatty acid--CoA ligase [Sulfobacillus acidophilus]|uniref:Long-chain fatty acid--CoA ligase n=1 Tax=Sulfobacillus acidophilus TaxID=53633 RepID=A0A2T2WFR6_9FIRM|nr:MAG: long-chain fatty acid--CoA ligase [Sulfobacillus acidophilus]